MSVLGWVANLLHVKASEALSRHEGPEATLAHAYEKQLAGLQELKLHLAEVKAEARALAERLAPLQRAAEAATLEDDAARLRERLERFRTEQEVVTASAGAAAARAQAAAQLSGSGD